MSYQVVLVNAAKRDLRHLDHLWQRRIASRLQKLSANPRPSGVVKLRGTENAWRLRLGDYRLIYEIDDDKRLVTILRIKYRREAYR